LWLTAAEQALNRRSTRINSDIVDQARSLLKQGISGKDIAKKLGVTEIMISWIKLGKFKSFQ